MFDYKFENNNIVLIDAPEKVVVPAQPMSDEDYSNFNI